MNSSLPLLRAACLFCVYCICIPSPHLCQSFQTELVAFPRVSMKNRRVVPMTLVIPTVFAEVNCMGIMLRSLSQSTALPAETIVVASGNHTRFAKEKQMVRALLSNYSSVLPSLKLVYLSDIQQQGLARNIGANLSSNSIVTFFDGDDYMHPQRIEIVHQMLQRYPDVDVLLHNWVTFVYEESIKPPPITNMSVMLRPDEIWKRYQALGWNRGDVTKDLRKDYRRLYLIWVFPEYSSLANGWSTMKRSVINTIPYTGTKGAEDSLHNANIILGGYNVMAIEARLGFYRQRDRHRRKTC